MRRLLRSWRWRVAVDGHSMTPTLQPGDWLLVDPTAYAADLPRAGDLVVTRDPRSVERWLVKRVAGVSADGRLRLAGDHPSHATEPTLDGVPPAALIGRPWLRYWPPARFGRVS